MFLTHYCENLTNTIINNDGCSSEPAETEVTK